MTIHKTLNKAEILKSLQEQLEKDLAVVKHAALATYGDATHEENKPENKYDTRALEASYLAGAQSERVKDVAELIAFCKVLKVREFSEDDPIAIGAVVEVESAGKTQLLFFLPKGGGVFFNYENQRIQVITPQSPLGKALIGSSAGDSVKLEGGQARTYEVLFVI